MSNPLKMWISKFRSFHKRNMRKRLKIPKGYLENVHRIRTNNIKRGSPLMYIVLSPSSFLSWASTFPKLTTIFLFVLISEIFCSNSNVTGCFCKRNGYNKNIMKCRRTVTKWLLLYFNGKANELLINCITLDLGLEYTP
jgi:hypothetical protein